MKTCTKCGDSLPATTEHFYKDHRNKNKLQSWCKKCMGEYAKERRRKKAKEAKEQIIETGPNEVPKFRIGQGVKVGQRHGIVSGIFKHFIVVDFKKYKECFPYRKIS